MMKKRREARRVAEPVPVPADLAEMIAQLSDRERFMLRGVVEAMLQWDRLELPKKANSARDLRDTPEYRDAMTRLRREVS